MLPMQCQPTLHASYRGCAEGAHLAQHSLVVNPTSPVNVLGQVERALQQFLVHHLHLSIEWESVPRDKTISSSLAKLLLLLCCGAIQAHSWWARQVQRHEEGVGGPDVLLPASAALQIAAQSNGCGEMPACGKTECASFSGRQCGSLNAIVRKSYITNSSLLLINP
jgi:hypothetical protein